MKRIEISVSFICLFMLISYSITCNAENKVKSDSICTHQIIRNAEGKLLSWYKPETNGAGYDRVVKLASEFIKNVLPVDPKTGLKLYYLFCEIDGPESGKSSYSGRGGSNNPARVFAGLTESLAVKYRIYSGDE